MTEGGWICLHRKLLKWEWASDPNTLALWIHLLLKANHKPEKWRGITVERGQLITGRKSLAKATGLTERQIRTALTKLKTTSEVSVKTTNRFSVITICNYNKYQDREIENVQPNDQPHVRQATSKRPQTTINNNTTIEQTKEKNIKKRKDPLESKTPYGEFKRVYLSETDKTKLKAEYDTTSIKAFIQKLDSWIEQDPTPKRVKNGHNAMATFRSWVIRAVKEERAKTNGQALHTNGHTQPMSKIDQKTQRLYELNLKIQQEEQENEQTRNH